MTQPDCGPRKHAYEFLGNHRFSNTTIGPTGTRVKLSVRAVYKCMKCGKQRIAAPVHKAEWPQL